MKLQFDVDEYVSQKKSSKHVENMRVEFNDTFTKYRKPNEQSKRWLNVRKRKNANAPTQEFKNVFRKLLSNKDDPQYEKYKAQLKQAGFKYDGSKQTHRFSRVKTEDSSPKNRVKKRVKFEESEAKPLIKRVTMTPSSRKPRMPSTASLHTTRKTLSRSPLSAHPTRR